MKGTWNHCPNCRSTNIKLNEDLLTVFCVNCKHGFELDETSKSVPVKYHFRHNGKELIYVGQIYSGNR